MSSHKTNNKNNNADHIACHTDFKRKCSQAQDFATPNRNHGFRCP
jgi:hypothetical protein